MVFMTVAFFDAYGIVRENLKIKKTEIIPSFLSCGGPTRTNDLWVMSPTSYRLLHSAIHSTHF